MTINDLVNTLTDDTKIMVHDLRGGEIFPQSYVDDMPEFMYEYTVKSVRTCGEGVISVVIDNETYSDAFSIIQQLAYELNDLEGCHSLEGVDRLTVDRLRCIARTAHTMAFNIKHGKPWQTGIFNNLD